MHLGVSLALFLNIFFYSKLIRFVACSLKEVQNFSIQFSPRYKLCLFSILSKAHIVDIEYPQGICSTNFVVEDFYGLFAHPSIILTKGSMLA